MANVRMSRINSEMQKALAEIIANRMRNPDFDGLIISVTKVETAPDLKNARIYISVLSSLETKRLVVAELNRSKGYVRRELMHMIRLKTMPELEFKLDNSIEEGQKIMDIIEKLSGETNEN